ncbi:MAG: hypothetical protein AAB874_07740, partial [Patescibacteria group bacterium]
PFTGFIQDDYLTYKETQQLIGQPCSVTSLKPNHGYIYAGPAELLPDNRIWKCLLYCGIDQQTLQEKIKFDCSLPVSETDDEKICSVSDEDKVIYKKSPNTVLESCGYEEDCSTGICVENPLCEAGQCRVRQNKNCTTPGEIKPDAAAPNKYLKCSLNKVWEEFAGGETITFNQSCTTTYREFVLQGVSFFSDYLFPVNPNTVDCAEARKTSDSNVYGGYSNNYFTFSCGNINEPKGKEECLGTIIHEFIHKFDEQQPSLTNEFDKKANGCTEVNPPGGVYTFTESPVSSRGYLNCAEAFAEAVRYYRLKSCEMKKSAINQYNFIKTKLYGGVEFCQP